MKTFIVILLTLLLNCNTSDEPANIMGVVVKDIELNEVLLTDFKGKVLLIVNVASECGFTPQYEDLQKIYTKYKDRGFEVLAFPCNDFGGQEPGSNEEIAEFCSLNYNVTFPLFDKIHVKGQEQSPLFDILTNNKVTGDSSIMWNFEKFIIDKEGNVVDRFRSSTKPQSEKITSLIEKELSK